MKSDESIILMGRIKEKANEFLINTLKEIGINDIHPSHARIIFNLHVNKKLTYQEVAQKINRDKSTVTGLIHKLIKNGYVISSKDEKDSRYKYLHLTEKGGELLPVFKEITEMLYKKEYFGIKETDKELFLSVLKLIYNNFE